ncbi:MAG: PAS domain S-box protein [Deltaproteobacteria bacterium]|nr:PAS domain S-box protein [Deltaproteobacteria bacterium]
MKNLFPSSIRAKLILLGVLAFLPVVLVTVFNSWYQRRLEVADAKERMAKILDFAILHEEEVIRVTHRILATLAEVPIIREGGGPASEYLARLLKNSPEYANIGLIRPDGQVIASALPFKKSLNLSDRSYFQDAINARTLSVGQYQVGRITGTPVINFGYPVIDRQGKLTAVIFAALDLSRVTEFEAEIHVQTPANSTYVKLDSHGSVLSAYPEAQVFGRGHPLEGSLFQRISKEKKGTFEAVGADGVERLFLFSPYQSPMNKEGGYVLLGISTRALFAEVDRLLVMNLAVLALIAVLFLAIMRFGGITLIARPVGILVDASKRLAGGDLTARSGLASTQGEFGQLGRAFDAMAEEIQRRQEESRKMQETLRLSAAKAENEKAKTEAIISAIGDGISIQDREFRILYQNEVTKNLIGEHLGKFCYEAYEEKDQVCESCPVAMAYRNGGVHTVEKRVETEKGVLFVEITASPLRDASGDIVAGVEVVRDITARRRGEEDRARLAMAVDQSAEAVVITGREGTILYVNPAFERITGYSREEAVGKNPRILRSGKQDESFYREMWGTLARGEIWEGHFINRKKDGSLYEEDATISPVRDPSGNIVSFVAVKRDVTRLLSLEKQVRMAQKMEAVGTLAGGVAHDFNNVLTVIIGFGEMLRRRIASDPKSVSDLDQILGSAERAAVLTRQLLTFARRQIIDLVNLDLNQVVTDLDRLLRKVTREDIEIKTFPAESPVTIRADRGQVEQVLMNLCLNARDAMPEGGQLVIEAGATTLEEGYLEQWPYMKAGRYVVLSVSDTGIGMDEKTRERIFEPFFTTKGPEKGTGLGLAVVYGIVKQHNGFIHVYSEPGRGSTFRVYFPAVDAPHDGKSAAFHAVTLGGNESILLAEDEESVRNMMEQTLKSYGYRVLVARDGEEAVGIFRRHGKEIAMAVLDVVMPKMGGKQAYDEMTKILPGLKVLFLSGYSANAIHESFVLLPGLSFLQKPFRPEAVARKVRKVLDGK